MTDSGFVFYFALGIVCFALFLTRAKIALGIVWNKSNHVEVLIEMETEHSESRSCVFVWLLLLNLLWIQGQWNVFVIYFCLRTQINPKDSTPMVTIKILLVIKQLKFKLVVKQNKITSIY